MNLATAVQPVMSISELEAFFRQAFPDAEDHQHARIDAIEPGRVRLILEPEAMGLRPGGVVSGPTQMGLADRAAYAVILAHIGPVAMAVTSNLNYSFLRPVPHARLTADALLLKLGRRLATVDVRLWQDLETRVLGQATVTYAIPV